VTTESAVTTEPAVTSDGAEAPSPNGDSDDAAPDQTSGQG